jgi:hypothetical protein
MRTLDAIHLMKYISYINNCMSLGRGPLSMLSTIILFRKALLGKCNYCNEESLSLAFDSYITCRV